MCAFVVAVVDSQVCIADDISLTISIVIVAAKSAPDESSAAVCTDEKIEIYEEVEMDTNNTYEAINI